VLDKDNLDKGSPFKLDLKITDLDQLRYITTHQYLEASDVIIDPTKYDTTNDSFYNPGTDKDQNPRLDFATLLEKYMQKDTNNDYIIDADHPVFIDPADLGGIDLPTDIDPALLIDNAFHNHQSLKLEVTDVNTNPPLNDSGGGDLHGFSVKGH
jgi:hypothetical protein